MDAIAVGQVWRHTDRDGLPLHGRPDLFRNGRTVRVEEREADGRWRILTLTGSDGEPPTGKGRATRVKDSTLVGTYELQGGDEAGDGAAANRAA